MSRRPMRGRFPPGAIEHLRGADRVLCEIIDQVGPFEPSHEPDMWRALVDAITSQQLSVRAAATIVGRVAELAPGGFPQPEQILNTPEDVLRTCGLSRPKARYLHDLAAKWLDGTLRPDRFPEMADEQVIAELIRVKGIGRWTAEMLLIFSLGRPDVLPVDDLGFRNAVQRAYGLPDRPGRAELTALGEPWRPFRSAATLYLWRSLNTPVVSGAAATP